MQTTLFPQPCQIGDIVESIHTNQRIRVKKLHETFIVGTLVDFTPYPLGHALRCYDGTVILSYKNFKP